MRCEQAAELFFEPGDYVYSHSSFYCWTHPPVTAMGAMGGPRFRVDQGATMLVVCVTQVPEEAEARIDRRYTGVVLLLVEDKLLWAWESQVDACPLNDR